MADSVYRVTEVIGVSSESWDAAARNAVETGIACGPWTERIAAVPCSHCGSSSMPAASYRA